MIFDEAHIDEVFKSFQTISYLNLDIQYILLSATISNSEEVISYMNSILDNNCLIVIWLVRCLFYFTLKISIACSRLSLTNLEAIHSLDFYQKAAFVNFLNQ